MVRICFWAKKWPCLTHQQRVSSGLEYEWTTSEGIPLPRSFVLILIIVLMIVLVIKFVMVFVIILVMIFVINSDTGSVLNYVRYCVLTFSLC